MPTLPSPASKKGQVHFLDWKDESDSVTVVQENEDRFNLKMRRAVEVLQLGTQIDLFTQELRVLYGELASWKEKRSDVAKAFLTIHDSRLLFLVVRQSCEYDEEFEDELSSLDWRIAHDADLKLVRMHTLSLPCVSDEALDSFLDPAFVILVNS